MLRAPSPSNSVSSSSGDKSSSSIDDSRFSDGEGKGYEGGTEGGSDSMSDVGTPASGGSDSMSDVGAQAPESDDHWVQSVDDGRHAPAQDTLAGTGLLPGHSKKMAILVSSGRETSESDGAWGGITGTSSLPMDSAGMQIGVSDQEPSDDNDGTWGALNEPTAADATEAVTSDESGTSRSTKRQRYNQESTGAGGRVQADGGYPSEQHSEKIDLSGAENKEVVVISDQVQSEDDSVSECPICLTLLRGSSERGPSQVLPCGHSFHENCINTWIIKRGHVSCPSCRTITVD
jgi:hypothetical protein